MRNLYMELMRACLCFLGLVEANYACAPILAFEIGYWCACYNGPISVDTLLSSMNMFKRYIAHYNAVCLSVNAKVFIRFSVCTSEK